MASSLGAFVLTTLLTLPPTTTTLTPPVAQRQAAPGARAPTVVTAMPLYEWTQAEIPYAALPR